MFSSLISSSSSDPAAGGANAPGLPAPPGAAGAGQPSGANAQAGAQSAHGGSDSDAFGLFRDVSCPVDVVLGVGQISLRRCLALERGSVVRLHQSAGEDLQVMVKGIRIAHAEVVIIDETVAVRLTHFAGPIREKRL